MLNEVIALVSAFLGLGICYLLVIAKRFVQMLKTVYRLDQDTLFMPGFFVKFSSFSQTDEKQQLLPGKRIQQYTDQRLDEVSKVSA